MTELECTVDRERKNKPKGHLNWVAADTAVRAEVRLYSSLFTADDPLAVGDAWPDTLDQTSLVTVKDAVIDPSLAALAVPGARFQFERLGYFVADDDSKPSAPIFNRIVELRDGYRK